MNNAIGQGEYPILPEIKIPLPVGDELPVPVIQGGISYNDRKPFMRNLGRALLPKKVENWFLGSQEDEDLLNKYSDSDLPTSAEIAENFKNGLYSKDDVLKFSDLRTNYDNAKANREYTDVRNANIGQGIVDIGSAAIGGGGAAATKAGINMLKPYVGRKIAQGITQGALGGALGGAAHGFGTGLVQEDVNPFSQALIEGGIGTVAGAGLGYGTSQIGKNLALKGIRNNIDDTLRQQQYFDDYIEGLNNAAVSKQGLSMNDIRALKIGDYGQKGRGLEYNFIGENAFNAPKGKLMEAKQMEMYGDSNADIRNATGWFKGVDGKWRYEIPDGSLIENPNVWETKNTGFDEYQISKLGDIYDNPELYQAYPKLKDLSIIKSDLPDGVGGISTPNSIHIDNSLYSKHNPNYYEQLNKLKQTPEVKRLDEIVNEAVKNGYSEKLDNEYNNILSNTENGKLYNSLVFKHSTPQKVEGWNDDALDTFVHEIQHQIQDIEGFARGGNSSLNPNYRNLAGEVEARLAGARAKLTPEQRQIYNPANESTYLTNYGYDVVPEKQIVEFKKGNNNLYNKIVDNDVIDLTDLFNGTPSEKEVRKTVQDLINSGKVMDTADKNWKMDIQERKHIRGKSTEDHVVNSDKWDSLNPAQKRRLRKYVKEVERVINNSKYTNKTSPNTKPFDKPDVDKYHYFEAKVKVGDNTYNLLLDTEQYIGDSIKKPQTVHLYNIKEKGKIK